MYTVLEESWKPVRNHTNYDVAQSRAARIASVVM